MRLTVEQYHRLIDAGILDNVELIEGRLVMGRYEIGLTPEQYADARAAGIDIDNPASEDTAALIDGIPSAWEATQDGLAQARRGEGTPLDPRDDAADR